MQIVLAKACKNVEAQYVEMMVPLYSHGCEKKVKKTLSHLKGKLVLPFSLIYFYNQFSPSLCISNFHVSFFYVTLCSSNRFFVLLAWCFMFV